jgi:hypothetical protein
VSTARTLAHFGGSRSRRRQAQQQQAQQRYRALVEAGRGERPVSSFERAFAGLVLGGEAFVVGCRIYRI